MEIISHRDNLICGQTPMGPTYHGAKVPKLMGILSPQYTVLQDIAKMTKESSYQHMELFHVEK